jgi:hypothetical protein
MQSSINNNDTADENEKVRRPLLTNGTPTSPSNSNSPQKSNEVVELDEVKFLEGKTTPVQDKGNVIYFIFLLFGIATLLPWNVFINSTDVSSLLLLNF